MVRLLTEWHDYPILNQDSRESCVHQFAMHVRNWHTEEIEVEGYSLKLRSYELGGLCVTELESEPGSTLARAIGKSPNESRAEALQTATRRLLWPHYCRLMVGG